MTKRKKRAKAKAAPRCSVVKVCGGRRRLCRDSHGRIKTNTGA